ncbi:MAG: pyridoxamine 5'-phosphate oxidase [Pseudomonadales bacterium]|nr:pyridoxamine 5'-phosphate oxidase [Pseudomonadales bacterium]
MNTFKALKLMADPLQGFAIWLKEAEAAGIEQSEAASLATVNNRGAPSMRTVLYKGMSKGGFCFYTNYNSPKSRDIEQNSSVALLFFWQVQARQIRITGTVEKLSESESQAYFLTRDRGSQIGAWASEQSEELESRDALMQRVAELTEMHAGKEVPCPPHWGGFRVLPSVMEFWQGRDDRLHDRFQFSLDDAKGKGTADAKTWRHKRLAP